MAYGVYWRHKETGTRFCRCSEIRKRTRRTRNSVGDEVVVDLRFETFEEAQIYEEKHFGHCRDKYDTKIKQVK